MNIRTRVAIVGAGASGLQCANHLVTKLGYTPDDIIILEARDRIGGRIHTTHESCVTIDGQQRVDFVVDHGAAWVHGTGLDWEQSMENYSTTSKPIPNPMIEILYNDTTIRSAGETIYTKHLNNVVLGNPWMRPNTVLHKTDNIALYMNGLNIDNNSNLVQQAIKRHYWIMQKVSQRGMDLFNKGSGMETIQISLQDMIDRVIKEEDIPMFYKNEMVEDQEEYDKESLELLSNFYQYLLECWYGSSATDLQLNEFTDDDNRLWDGDDQSYTEEGDFYGPHCTLKAGMECIPLALIKDNGLTERIILNQNVIKISKDENENVINSISNKRITVTTEAGLTVHCDCCVVTIPTGCLKESLHKQLFHPNLRREKQEAIQSTKMGTYKKVFLTFNRIFWPTNPAFLGLIRPNKNNDNDSSSTPTKNLDCTTSTTTTPTTPTPTSNSTTPSLLVPNPLGTALLCDNLWSCNGIPCIEAILFGKSGEWAKYKTDEEIRSVVVEFIFDAFGIIDNEQKVRTTTTTGTAASSTTPNSTNDSCCCIDCSITRWEEDPYSLGAYTSMTVGASIFHIQELNHPEWDGSLLFSGEGTIVEHEGSVHAALFSGINAAEKVKDYFSK